MEKYLLSTPLLDYEDETLVSLVAARQWRNLPVKERIAAIYVFVRDEILFGYNRDDAIAASEVLSDGYGQCNTKATLFMALLRAVGVPCRLHGFTIDKKLQKGAQTGLTYLLAPREIVHSWTELFYDGEWLDAEGLILDKAYLGAVQRRFADCRGGFCGYGIATDDLAAPPVDWDGNSTYIQSKGIVRDLGVYASPDAFFAAHRQALSPLKKWLFLHVGRPSMNRNVAKMRRSLLNNK